MKRQHLTDLDPASGTLGESRSRVLEILQDTGAQLGVNEVAAKLSLHPNTVRFHLDALVASGLVDSEPEENDLRGRPRMLYSANANNASAGRRNYRLLAEILASSMGAQVSHLSPHRAGEDLRKEPVVPPACARVVGVGAVQHPRASTQVTFLGLAVDQPRGHQGVKMKANGIGVQAQFGRDLVYAQLSTCVLEDLQDPRSALSQCAGRRVKIGEMLPLHVLNLHGAYPGVGESESPGKP